MINSFLIGISGGSCSGKTTMANLLTEKFKSNYKAKNCIIISEDDYYHNTNTLNDIGLFDGIYDDPISRDHNLLIEHLSNLKAGNNINAPIYDFVYHKRKDETKIIKPAEIIIIEGTHIFCNPQLRELLDYKIYLNLDDEQKLLRRIKRDTTERGRIIENVKQQYKGVKKAYIEFTAPTKIYANMIIDYAFDKNTIDPLYNNIIDAL